MERFPIVIEGDWIQLTFEEAEDREQALINAATRYTESVDEPATISKVTGGGTPTVELKVYREDGSLDSTWTVPDQH